jgi:hypothetical protein
MTQEGNRNENQPTTPGTAGPSRESERRAAARHPSTLRINCYPAGSGLAERRLARVRNVSRTGIGLVLDRHWPPGTALIFELPVEDGVRSARGRVIHATSQPGGTFLVGCTFDLPLSDVELQALAR